MRSYGRFTTDIYRDEDFRSLTLNQQGLYYLLGLQPEVTAAGTLSLTLRRWANQAAEMTPDAIRDELKVLEDRGHIVVDEDTEELLIVKFVKRDGGVGNEKRRPVIREAALAIASKAIRHRLAHELAKLGHADMASELAPDMASDSQSGFDRVVVTEGESIPQSHSAIPEREPPQAASPIQPGETGPPSMFCSKHPQGTTEACGPCGSTRTAYVAWAKAKTDREVEAKRSAVQARAACIDCDDRGMNLDPVTRQPTGRCAHPNIGRTA